MSARFVLLLPLLLAACALPEGNSPEAECQRAVYDDPTVRDIYSSSNMQYTLDLPVRYQLEAAKRAAYQRCMQAKGLAPPGGVQPVQPSQW